MFRAQGFDLDPDDPAAPEACEASCGSFKDQVPVHGQGPGRRASTGSGFPVEFALADDDTDFGFMTVEKGRIAGFKGTVVGE